MYQQVPLPVLQARLVADLVVARRRCYAVFYRGIRLRQRGDFEAGFRGGRQLVGQAGLCLVGVSVKQDVDADADADAGDGVAGDDGYRQQEDGFNQRPAPAGFGLALHGC